MCCVLCSACCALHVVLCWRGSKVEWRGVRDADRGACADTQQVMDDLRKLVQKHTQRGGAGGAGDGAGQ